MKKLIGFRTLLLSLILMPSLKLNAQQEVAANLTDGISSSEAVTLALQRNRGLLAIRKGHAVAESGVSEAKALPDPELRTGRFDFDDVDLIQSNSIALRWSPPRLLERSLKGSWALGKVSEVDGEIAAAAQRLATDMRLLHMNIIFLDEQIRLAEAAVEVRQQIADFIATQVEAGLKTVLDQSIAELVLADVRSIPGTYRVDRRVSMSRLANELDLPRSPGLTIQLEGEPLMFQPRDFDLPLLIETALARRPELAILPARCSQAEATLSLRKSEQYPWFSFVQLSREFRTESRPDAWGFRVGIDLPIFEWMRKSVQGPAAELEQCRTEVEAMKSRINMEVEELVERLRAHSSELEYYRQTIEPLAQLDIDLSERAIEAGRSDLLQRLTAEAQRLRQQQTYISKLRDYRRLEIELDQATGNAIQQ